MAASLERASVVRVKPKERPSYWFDADAIMCARPHHSADSNDSLMSHRRGSGAVRPGHRSWRCDPEHPQDVTEFSFTV